MLFFYIRHGDPTYDPDALTPLGHKQAEAVAKRLALYGVDEIFASTSNRAIQTAQPTCNLLKKDMILLDFCNECYTWRDLTLERENGKAWLFEDIQTKLLFTDKEIVRLGEDWHNHEKFKKYNFGEGLDRIRREANKFFADLGFEHLDHTGKYRVTKTNNDRVALFAHQSFGLAFMSCVFDIPYPQFCTHFDMCHSGITVIEFKDEGGYAIPKILTLSSDSHLYREGLPTNYNNILRF